MSNTKLLTKGLKVESIRELGMLPEQRLLTTYWEYNHFLKNIENKDDVEFIKKFKELKTGRDLEGIQKITPLNPYGEIKERDWRTIRERILFIPLHITRLCNSNCNICYHEAGTTEDMSLKDIQDFLSRIGRGKRIFLVGGEPTCREDLFEIIRAINKSGNYVELCTNGLKLADEDYVKKLREHNLRKVAISFDGFGEEVYEKLRGNGKQYYTKLKALENLEKHRITTILFSVIAEGINDDQIPKLLKFVVNSIENKGPIRGINFFSATPYGKFDIKVERVLTELDIIKILEKVPFAEIDREYILEFERLKRNIDRKLKFFRNRFPIIPGFTPRYKVEGGRIKELIPLEDLKKMNRLLKEGKLFQFALRVFRYKELRPLLKYILNPTKIADAQYNNDALMSIRISRIRVPNMPEVDYDDYSIVSVGKHKNKIILLALT